MSILPIPFFDKEHFLPQLTYRDSNGCMQITSDLIFTINHNFTESVSVSSRNEFELSPYCCCRDSGTLDFWDEPEEDIYTLEDGQPIE
ncbi:MAG: hypothetical protein JW709_05885 [Sedimentisphaerales bacterium]|nr:hypothetical protein [Sedimentisphaerales bacterium]